MDDIKENIKNSILLDMVEYISKDARDRLERSITKALHGYDVAEGAQLPATTENTNEYIMRLFETTKGAKLAPKTLRQYKYTLTKFADTVHRPFTKVSTLDVEYFLTIIRKTNSATSCNNYLRNISAFYTWMRKSKLLIYNPCESVTMYKEVHKPIDHLTVEEIDRLKTGCRAPRDRALIEFMRCTALRCGDISRLRVCDIDYATGKIMVFMQKSNRYTTVMVDCIALKYIGLYLAQRGVQTDSTEPLFIGKRGDALGESGMNMALKRIARTANLKRNIYPHLMRKTTATQIVARGGSIEDAGIYLGHAQRSVTGRHYAYIDDNKTVQIFNRYIAAVG